MNKYDDEDITTLPCGLKGININCADNCPKGKKFDTTYGNTNEIEQCYHLFSNGRQRNYIEIADSINTKIKFENIESYIDDKIDNIVREESIMCPYCFESYGSPLGFKGREIIECVMCLNKFKTYQNKDETFTSKPMKGEKQV